MSWDRKLLQKVDQAVSRTACILRMATLPAYNPVSINWSLYPVEKLHSSPFSFVPLGHSIYWTNPWCPKAWPYGARQGSHEK